MHLETDAQPPLSMMARYPATFVRKCHAASMYNRSLDSQRSMISAVYDPYVEAYHGAGNAHKSVPWRELIKDLHGATERALMDSPAPLPQEMSITKVTTMLDSGRDTADHPFELRWDAI